MASSLSIKTLHKDDDALLKRGLRDFTLKKEQYECMNWIYIPYFSASARCVQQLVLRCTNNSVVCNKL